MTFNQTNAGLGGQLHKPKPVSLSCDTGRRHRPRGAWGAGQSGWGSGGVRRQGDDGNGPSLHSFSGGRAPGWRCFCPHSQETRLPQAPPPGPGPLPSGSSGPDLTTCWCFLGGSPPAAFGQQRCSLDKQESLRKLTKGSAEPCSRHPSGARAYCPTWNPSWLPVSRPSSRSGAFVSPDPEGGPGQGPATPWILSARLRA